MTEPLGDADAVLARVVDPRGRVDYAALASRDLKASLAAVANAQLHGPSRLRGAFRYAFLLNAYNLVVLDAVQRRLLRDGRQVRSLRNPFWWLVFFLATPVRVGGRRMSLFRLEFQYLKPHLRRDGRGHFAFVCAATGCPPLRDGLFHGESLDAELDLAAGAFMQPGAGYVLDREAGVLRLSRILKWYAGDFGGRAGVLEAFQKYAPADDAKWVSEHSPRVRFMRYDWDLNVANK